MRKVRLSTLMEDIASHLAVYQKPVIGFLLEKRDGELRAKPISELSTPLYPYQGMVILPSSQVISEMPKTLKGLAEMVEALETYMHIQMDITLAGYVYMLLNPFFSGRDIRRDYIWADIDDACFEPTEIIFTDKSKIVIRMDYIKLAKKLAEILDLAVVEEAHAYDEI